MPGRYFAFATSALHENYGWRDFIGAHDSIADALAAIAAFEPDPDVPGGDFEGNIGDSVSLKCVLAFERQWGVSWVYFEDISDEDAVRVKLAHPELFEESNTFARQTLPSGVSYHIVRETVPGEAISSTTQGAK